MKEEWYDEEADILNIEIMDKKYWKSIEITDDVILDISRDYSIISIEILNASKFLLKN